MKRILSKVLIFSMALMMFGAVPMASASPTDMTNITLSQYATDDASAGEAVTVTYVINSAMSSDDTLVIVPDGTSGAELDSIACGAAFPTSIDGDGVNETCDDSGTNIIITFSGGPSTTIAVPIIITEASEGIYYLELEINSQAMGAITYSVGDETNVNDGTVEIRAGVSPTLDMSITEGDSNTLATLCDLGVLDSSSTNTCHYRVHAGTNSNTGTIQIRVIADGPLTEIVGGVETIDDLGAVNTALTPGNEEHGFQITAHGDLAGGLIDEYGQPNPDPVPQTSDAVLSMPADSDMSGANTSDDYLQVDHLAGVSSTTLAGQYKQEVTWTAVVYF